MSDAKGIVDRIRIFLSSRDRTRNEELVLLAESYANLCKEANQRLQRCEQFLNKKMRTEAIYEAENPSSLLDLVSILDFPEFEEWRDICITYNLPEPPRLLTHIIPRLQEAYSYESKLSTFLTEYRRAVQTGNLKKRIELLRQLTSIEPSNLNWSDELVSTELARLNEIEKETEHALKNNDERTLNKLADELSEEEWTIKSNPRFIALRKKYAYLKGKKLVEKIVSAYNEFNFQELEVLFDEWNYLLSDKFFVVTKELLTQISDALEWYKTELEKRQNEEKAREKLEAERKFKKRLVFTLIGGVIVLLTLLIVIYHSVQSRRQKMWREMVISAINESDYQKADELLKYLESNNPSMFRQDFFQIQRELVDQKKEEIKCFGELMGQLEEVQNNNFEIPASISSKSSIENRCPYGIKKIMRQLSKAERSLSLQWWDELLKQTEQLIPDSTGKQRFNDFRNAWQKFKTKKQREIDDKFIRSIDSIRGIFQEMRRLNPLKEMEKLKQKAEEARSKLAEAEMQIPEITEEIRNNKDYDIEQLKNECEKIVQDAEKKVTDHDRELQNIRNALPAIEAYERAIRLYIRDYPNEDKAFQFRKILEFIQYYKEADSINSISDIPVSITDNFSAAENFLKNASTDYNIWAKPIKRYLTYLNPDNGKANKSVYNTLRNLKDSKVLHDLFSITIKDEVKSREGRVEVKDVVYFYSEIKTMSEEMIIFKPYDKNTCWEENNEKKIKIRDVVKEGALTPHSQYVREFLQRLGNPNFTAMGYDIFLLKEIIKLKQVAEIEPIVKANLLKFLLQQVQSVVQFPEYSSIINKGFNRIMEVNLDVCWMDDKPEVKEVRKVALKVIRDLPDFQDILKRIQFEKELLKTSLRRKVQCVGSIQMNGNQMFLNILDPTFKELWILRITNGEPEFIVIANKNRDTFEIDPEVGKELFDGQPVFAPRDGKKTRDVLEEIIKDLNLEPSILEEFKNWPQSWPVNARTVKINKK